MQGGGRRRLSEKVTLFEQGYDSRRERLKGAGPAGAREGAESGMRAKGGDRSTVWRYRPPVVERSEGAEGLASGFQ